MNDDEALAHLESKRLSRMDPATEAEVYLLSACWTDEENTKSLLGNLSVNDFHSGTGRLQYEVLAESWRRYRDVSPMSLRKISDEMGSAYLDSYGLLMEEHFSGIGSGVGPGQMRALMQQVSEETSREKFITALGQAQEALLNRELTLAEAQARTSELLYKATTNRKKAKPQSWDEGFANLEDKAQKRVEAEAAGKNITEFLPTGILPLDEIIGGIGVPEFCILAARPGVGKTAAGLQIATYVAQHVGPVLFLSLELSAEVCWTRIACQQLGLPAKEFKKRPDLIRQVRAKNINLHIDETPVKTRGLRPRIELHLLDQPKTVLVVLDQLSKLVDDSSDYRQMTAGCNVCCSVTTDMKIPFMLLTQVGRKGELREKGKPQMSDLKATGALEEDARKVILLDRPWMHSPGKCDPKDLNIIVAKNGDGESGTAEASFDGSTYSLGAAVEKKFKPRKGKDEAPPPSDADAPSLLGEKMF